MPSLEERLAHYLGHRIPGARDVRVTRLVRIPGGASRETLSVDAEWTGEQGERGGAGFIFRRDPPASLLESDRRLEFEFYRSFAGSAVPVPRPLWLETDPQWLDRPFFVMERIDEGESQFQRLIQPDFDPYRQGLARRMYSILGEIVRTPIDRLPARQVVEVPAPDQCWRRELDHWEGVIDRAEMEPQPVARAAIRALRRHPPPPPARVTVVHGDYRTGNFIYRGEEILAVLDWEMAHFGDPLEDLAWSLMRNWQWARDGRVGGLVEREEAIRLWEEATGLRADREALRWWEIFSGVKAQGIWLTGAREFAEGRATDVILAFTSYWLINSQDRFLLETMGKMALP